jgi:hypothetical protein
VQLYPIHFWQVYVEQQASIGFRDFRREQKRWSFKGPYVEASGADQPPNSAQHGRIVVAHENLRTFFFIFILDFGNLLPSKLNTGTI